MVQVPRQITRLCQAVSPITWETTVVIKANIGYDEHDENMHVLQETPPGSCLNVYMLLSGVLGWEGLGVFYCDKRCPIEQYTPISHKPYIKMYSGGIKCTLAKCQSMSSSGLSQWKDTLHIDGLAQNCSNSSALAVELLQSCAKPLICNKLYVMPSLIGWDLANP